MKKKYEIEMMDRLLQYITLYKEGMKDQRTGSFDCVYVLENILKKGEEIKNTPYKKP
jgi:hypothetical protein